MAKQTNFYIRHKEDADHHDLVCEDDFMVMQETLMAYEPVLAGQMNWDYDHYTDKMESENDKKLVVYSFPSTDAPDSIDEEFQKIREEFPSARLITIEHGGGLIGG